MAAGPALAAPAERVVPNADGAPKFVPGRYAKQRAEGPGSGIARGLHELSGGIFDWTLISRAAEEEILALTGEVATGFSLGRSIPGAVEPA